MKMLFTQCLTHVSCVFTKLTTGMESNGRPSQIHVSKATADLLTVSGRGRWLKPRADLIEAKGKGKMQTYWVYPNNGGAQTLSSTEEGATNTDHNDASTMECSVEEQAGSACSGALSGRRPGTSDREQPSHAASPIEFDSVDIETQAWV